MPVFIDALIGDTLRLTAEEFGCYCLLLFATWRNNGEALPDDATELAQICRVTTQRWRGHMRAKLVRFFDLSDGHWHQKRLEKEWAYVQAKHETNRANGLKGGRPKNPPDNPPATQTKPNGSVSVNPNRTERESTHTHTHSKLASLASSEELPRGELPRAWADAAAAARAAEGLPDVDLSAEWAKLRAKISEPTEARWLAWALKARAQRPGNGSTDPAGLPAQPWPQRLDGWVKTGFWLPTNGPAPDEPGCWAPADLIAEALARRAAQKQPIAAE